MRMILCLPIAALGLNAQPNERFPTQPVLPIILPYEPGGAEVHLHTRENDSKPFPAHKIIGNIYYTGLSDYGSYLITSSQGHILIDPTFRSTVPLVEESIRTLGFKVHDIRIILTTHAHADHSEGAARMKDLTGAQLMVMDGDARTVESGGGNMPPAKVDRILHEGDQVRLGPTTITVHLAAGHTKGNTTFAWKTEENGKTYNASY